MSKAAYTDWLGITTTGLEICGNAKGASNSNIEVTKSDGSYIKDEKYGSIAAPRCDYKITGNLTTETLNALKLGKVHGSNTGPYALKTINIHTGAGDEPTFSAQGVQLASGATATVCVFTPDIAELSPARHALTFGAFSFTESDSLTLQSGDLTVDCEIDPTIINGVPKAADAVKAFQLVTATMWMDSDATPPSVTVATSDGWFHFTDWDCTGSEGSLYVWTASFKKYLSPDA
jgi:hypothetical protein